MKYYLHDSNSFQDEKVTELFINYGYEGLGLFYTLLEKFALQEKPIKTVVLKRQLLVGKKLEKCWKFMESLELIYSNNGETFNENILKFTEKFQKSQEKNKKRISQWREKQEVTENVTRSECVRNADNLTELNLTELNLTEHIKEDVFEDEILSDTVNTEKKEISLKILRDFGFNEISNPDKLRIISGFVYRITDAGRLQYFSDQYRAYMEYKNLSGEVKHNLITFLGHPQDDYNGKGAGWDSANWTEKLNSLQKTTKIDQYKSAHNAVIDKIRATAAGHQAV